MPPADQMTTAQRAYFWSGAVLPTVSVVGYTLGTRGTIRHFQGEPSDAAWMWCLMTASGDAAFAFLSATVLRDGVKASRWMRIVLRVQLAYALLHFGSFWLDHTGRAEHPFPAMYPMGILGATVGLWLWGR